MRRDTGLHTNQGREMRAEYRACKHWWLSPKKKAGVHLSPPQEKPMDAGDAATHRAPPLPTERAGWPHLTALLRNAGPPRLELHKHEHPYYNPSLRKTDYLKENKSKLKRRGFQSNLFIKIYSICHQQFSWVYCADK